MAAKNPARRAKTAKELAEKYGASDRTIRRMIAEPREDFEGRARLKQLQAQELRAQGLLYKEIADRMGISIGSVSVLLRPRRQEAKAS